MYPGVAVLLDAASHLREPEVKVFDAGVEVLLLVGLLQFLTLFCRFVDEELPLLIQSVQTSLRKTELSIRWTKSTYMNERKGEKSSRVVP